MFFGALCNFVCPPLGVDGQKRRSWSAPLFVALVAMAAYRSGNACFVFNPNSELVTKIAKKLVLEGPGAFEPRQETQKNTGNNI